jgi:hypothetical protein
MRCNKQEIKVQDEKPNIKEKISSAASMTAFKGRPLGYSTMRMHADAMNNIWMYIYIHTYIHTHIYIYILYLPELFVGI